jgi:hypothetical protein
MCGQECLAPRGCTAVRNSLDQDLLDLFDGNSAAKRTLMEDIPAH